MNLYLYTENFDSKSFDIFISRNGQEPERLSQEEEAAIIKNISDWECPIDVDSNGVAVHSYGRLKKGVSFKILLDQKSPSGRGRLVFGSTEASWIPFSSKDIDRIMGGVVDFIALEELSISVPDGRLGHLHDVLCKAVDKWKRRLVFSFLFLFLFSALGILAIVVIVIVKLARLVMS